MKRRSTSTMRLRTREEVAGRGSVTVGRGSHTREVWRRAAERMGTTLEQMLDGPAPAEVLLHRGPQLAEVAEVAAFLASDRAGA